MEWDDSKLYGIPALIGTDYPISYRHEYLGIRREMPIPTKEELQNRYSYHRPEGNQPQRYEMIRAECLNLANVICDNTPFSREQSTALTHLDAVMMFANAAIARNE